MNTLLDLTGGLLYLALSIILLPLFLLVDGLFLMAAAFRSARMIGRQWQKRMRKHSYRMPRIDMALKRGWIYLMPNRH